MKTNKALNMGNLSVHTQINTPRCQSFISDENYRWSKAREVKQLENKLSSFLNAYKALAKHIDESESLIFITIRERLKKCERMLAE